MHCHGIDFSTILGKNSGYNHVVGSKNTAPKWMSFGAMVINHSVESPIGSKGCRGSGLLLSCGYNTCNLSFFSSYRHGTLLAELSYLTFSLAILPFSAPKQGTYVANRPILIATAAVIRDETTRQ